MKLTQPVIELFDYPLTDLLPLVPESDSPLWDLHQDRRHKNADRSTRCTLFVWLGNEWQLGMPLTIEQLTDTPEPLRKAVHDVGTRLLGYYGGRITKLMLAELPPHGEIKMHRDRAPSLENAHRCHLPIISDERVAFKVAEGDYFLRPGRCYEVDNQRPHGVVSDSDQHRVHLICDIMPDKIDQTKLVPLANSWIAVSRTTL